MATFEDIQAGARLRGLDAAGVAEVLQVARYGEDALTLVFRVNGRVAERLDMAARSDALQAKLEAAPEWDLVICGEAHRIAASYFPGFAEVAVVLGLRELTSGGEVPA